MADDESSQRAILDEALKKGALVWLELPATTNGTPSRGHARWYAWNDGRIYLLTGDGEQPDPGLLDGTTIRVVVRSKDNRHRMLTLDADVAPLDTVDPDWGPATAELAKSRLNLSAADDAAHRWAGPGFTLYRLTPRLPLVEGPGEGSVESARRAPVPTVATTSARRPWVLHRRGGSGRPLS